MVHIISCDKMVVTAYNAQVVVPTSEKPDGR